MKAGVAHQVAQLAAAITVVVVVEAAVPVAQVRVAADVAVVINKCY